MGADSVQRGLIPALPPIEREVASRQVYIQKKQIMKHGYTQGADARKTARNGGRALTHSAQCRLRIEDEMKKDETQSSKL